MYHAMAAPPHPPPQPPPLPPQQQQQQQQQGAQLSIPTNVILQQQQQQQQQYQQHQQQQLSMNPYTQTWVDLLWELRQQMLTRAMKFDESFRNLLSGSKISLHNMFSDTYGMKYEKNTEIFTSMFESLEQYYANGQVKLTKSMETFFERLYQKIFQEFNASKSFTPAYLECVTEQLAHLKPFKDVPEKLIGGIRHAFLAARTLVQALNGGIDVIKNIMSVSRQFRVHNCCCLSAAA